MKTRCTLASNVGATMFFLLQNRSGGFSDRRFGLTKDRLCSMRAVIVIINGEMDDTDYATDIKSKFEQ